MAEQRVPWHVTVEDLGNGNWRTVFHAGVQHFTLAERCDTWEDADALEAGAGCRFIARMFIEAMARVGAPPASQEIE